MLIFIDLKTRLRVSTYFHYTALIPALNKRNHVHLEDVVESYVVCESLRINTCYIVGT